MTTAIPTAIPIPIPMTALATLKFFRGLADAFYCVFFF